MRNSRSKIKFFWISKKCEIKKKKNITGHSSEREIDAYDCDNEDEMFAMSSAISKSKCSSSTVPHKNLSHCYHRKNLNLISPGIFIEDPSTRTTFLSK